MTNTAKYCVVLMTLLIPIVSAQSPSSSATSPILALQDMTITHTSSGGVMKRMSDLDITHVAIHGGQNSSAGTFKILNDGDLVSSVSSGAYILSSLPTNSSNTNGLNSTSLGTAVSRQASLELGLQQIDLEFTVVPVTSILQFDFLYFLSGPVPTDFDFSRAFTILINGESCKLTGDVETNTSAVGVFGLQHLEFRTTQTQLTCTTTVIPGKECPVQVVARDVVVEDVKVSSAILLSVRSLPVLGQLEGPELLICDQKLGGKCLEEISNGLCNVRSCSGESFHADFEGDLCCRAIEKSTLTVCDDAKVNSDGTICCERVFHDSLVPTSSRACFEDLD